jgi:hypothetical protein
MRFESWHPNEEKRKFKIVRTDFGGPNGGDVEGEIVTSDEDTGECCITVAGETKTLSFGPGGIRIVERRR